MTMADTPGWYVEDDITASVKNARESDAPISSIVWELEDSFADDIPTERIKRIVESIPDKEEKSPETELPLSQSPATDAEPREQPSRIISFRDLAYLSPREAARVVGLALEQFDGNTVRPPSNETTECDLYWNRQYSTIGLRIISSVGHKVSEDDIRPLDEGETSIEDNRHPSQLAAVTNGVFTEQAESFADETGIQCYDCSHVEVWFRRAKITPEALGTVLEQGENHQGPLDELVDISDIPSTISVNPLKIEPEIDSSELASDAMTTLSSGEPTVSSGSTQRDTETGGSQIGGEALGQSVDTISNAETGKLYADPQEDGDYEAFDRFVDGIGSDQSDTKTPDDHASTVDEAAEKSDNQSTEDNTPPRKKLLSQLLSNVRRGAERPISKEDVSTYSDYSVSQYEEEFGSVEEALNVVNIRSKGGEK